MKEQDPCEYTRKCVGKGAFVFMTSFKSFKENLTSATQIFRGEACLQSCCLSELLPAEQIKERAGQGFY